MAQSAMHPPGTASAVYVTPRYGSPNIITSDRVNRSFNFKNRLEISETISSVIDG